MEPTLQDPISNPDLASAINRLADAISANGEAAPTEEAIALAADPSAGIDWSMDSLLALAGQAKEKLIEFAPAMAGAAAVLFVGWMIARFARRMVRKMMERAKVDPTLVNFLCSTLYAGLMVFVAVSAVGQLGVSTASFVAILGAATFAVGFALQGSLSNFASGVLMIIFRPIRKDDLVEAGGVLGVVEEVGVFATTINTPENKRAIIANGCIMGGNIINFTANGRLRVDMTFGIGYSDDMDKAIAIMKDILAKDERVMAEPEAVVSCVEHGASSVNFVCRPHVKPEHYWGVWFDTHKAVKEEFDRQGISIPFPQRDLHLIGGAGESFGSNAA